MCVCTFTWMGRGGRGGRGRGCAGGTAASRMLMRDSVTWWLLIWGLGLIAATVGWPSVHKATGALCTGRLSPLKASEASLHPVFGHELAKYALKLLAVNPAIGSLGLVGTSGTAKSILAHSLSGVLPPWIKSHDHAASPPFIVVPANVGEDRLFGSIDVKRTLECGTITKSSSLMARARGGILLVKSLPTMDSVLVAKLFQALGEGIVRVETEGLSYTYSCDSLLIATMQPGDDAPKIVMEHLSMIVRTDCDNWTPSDRAQAVGRAIQLSTPSTLQSSPSGSSGDQIRAQLEVMEARKRLKSIHITREQVERLVHTAQRIGCVGSRPEISAARVAVASAALAGSTVRPVDLSVAEELALFPKSSAALLRSAVHSPPQANFAGSATSQLPHHASPVPSASAPLAGSNAESHCSGAPEEPLANPERSDRGVATAFPEPSHSSGANLSGKASMAMTHIAASSPSFASILSASQSRRTDKVSTRTHRAGKGGQTLSYERGRFVRAVLPENGKPLRIAIFATLLEAAKRHAIRTNGSAANNSSDRIRIELQDLRAKIMTRNSAALRIIVMDTSGSMAANRMAKAKGAAALLVAEAYRSRDKVALISCSGIQAQVVLYPTKSLLSAKHAIDDLPCGGGSPLVHGLHEAMRIGCAALARGSAARCIVALISDGQPNIPLAVSMNARYSPSDDRGVRSDAREARQQLEQELLQLAKRLGSHPAFQLLVIDSENKRYGKDIGMAREIAQAGAGRYLRIPFLSASEKTEQERKRVGSDGGLHDVG